MLNVRLKDIAERAGVSMMTVSKALRDAHDISPSTKTQIKLLAQQMGYVPNSLARSLRSRRTRLLGLVLSNVANPIHTRLAMAIEERAHEMGYELIMAQTQNIPEREDSCILRLLTRRVDGLLIAPTSRAEHVARSYADLESDGTPTVIIGSTAPFCSRFVNVECDELMASARLTQHLFELGHRRIAFLAGPPLTTWAGNRLEGFRRAFSESNEILDDSCVFDAGIDIEDGVRAAGQFIQENCQATAVQAVNDLVAIGFAETMMRHGRRIPQDVSVAGFGNVLAAEHFGVPLTTVRQPKLTMGNAAMDLLHELIEGRHPGSIRLTADIEIRASTAPPKAPAAAPDGPA